MGRFQRFNDKPYIDIKAHGETALILTNTEAEG